MPTCPECKHSWAGADLGTVHWLRRYRRDDPGGFVDLSTGCRPYDNAPKGWRITDKVREVTCVRCARRMVLDGADLSQLRPDIAERVAVYEAGFRKGTTQGRRRPARA